LLVLNYALHILMHHKVNVVAVENNAVDGVIPGAAKLADRPD